jgi:hypothetical protein
MSSKNQTHSHNKAVSKRWSPKPLVKNAEKPVQQTYPASTIQRARLNPGSLTPADILQLQRTIGNQAVGRLLARTAQPQPIQKKENHTGLPDDLKAGIENLSGMSMDDVKVHTNSARPAEVEALAYTQGTDIHLGPGQETHLPHEAWHVAQQKQGRVKPTLQVKEVVINDDQALESEAEVMGAKALQMNRAGQATTGSAYRGATSLQQQEVETNQKPLQRRIRVKNGPTYNNAGALPVPLQSSADLSAKADHADTYLVNREKDLTLRAKGQNSRILSPHRHLIGELHNASRFDEALEDWGWGADKMLEGLSTSQTVVDPEMEARITSKPLIGTNIYYGAKHLENMHASMLQELSLFHYALGALEDKAIIVKDKHATSYSSKTAIPIATKNAFDKEYNYVKELLDEVIDKMKHYRAAAEGSLAAGNPQSDPEIALQGLAQYMHGRWDQLFTNLKGIKSNPWNNLIPEHLDSSVGNKFQLKAQAAHDLRDEIDQIAAAVVSMIGTEAPTPNVKATAYQSWANATGVGGNPLTDIGPIREEFMAVNINNNLNKPGIVQIGSTHVHNLLGRINDGKYHNAYTDFVNDLQN